MSVVRPSPLVVLAVLWALGACQPRDFGGVPYPIGELHFPITITPTPDQRFALVAHATFDLEFRAGALAVMDVERNVILEGRGVEVGNFAGEVALFTREGVARRAFVPVRDDDSIVMIDLDVDPADGSPLLSCSADGGSVCDEAHILREVGEGVPLGGDPFGALIYHEPRLDADLLVVIELAEGGVDVFALDDEGVPTPLGRVALDTPGYLSPVYVPATGRIILPNKFYNQITSFELDLESLGQEEGVLGVRARRDLTLPVGIASGDYFRRMVRVDDRLYVADRNSDRVVVLDAVSESVLGTLPALPGVTGLAVAPDGMLVVTAFDTRRLAVVDIASGSLLRVTGLTRRPYEVTAVAPAGSGLRRALVTSFTDHRIGAVDIDPASERFGEVIAFIR